MKTKYKDIIAEDNFRLNSKIYDLGRQAEIIQKIAEEQIKSEGEFAKFHCSNVAGWMREIAEQAQKALDIQFGKE